MSSSTCQRDWVKGIRATLADDALQQRVLLTYEMEGSKVNLKIAGAAFKPKKILGVNLDAAPSPTLQGVVTLPFGNFEVLFNDGDLRDCQDGPGLLGRQQANAQRRRLGQQVGTDRMARG